AVVDHLATPLAGHFNAYLTSLEAAGKSPDYRSNVRQTLKRVANECGFSTLRNLSADTLEIWLAAQAKAQMGARTRNIYRGALVTFCNWCIGKSRLVSNPFAAIAKADEQTDIRRKRRAM